MNNYKRAWTRLAAAAIAAGLVGLAQAQAYPAKPVKIIVPFGADGLADIYARAIAQRLAEPLGQQVIVEDRPGAGSAVGTDVAATTPGMAAAFASSQEASAAPWRGAVKPRGRQAVLCRGTLSD